MRSAQRVQSEEVTSRNTKREVQHACLEADTTSPITEPGCDDAWRSNVVAQMQASAAESAAGGADCVEP
jgi:hypothetical protein